jgi:hypothetical membrane protein
MSPRMSSVQKKLSLNCRALKSRVLSLASSSQRLTALCGFLGSGILLVGCILPIFSYRDSDGIGYSCLNHFISSLGRPENSPQAAVFNSAIVLGGVMLALFMLGLGQYFCTKLGYAAGVAGLLGGLACSGLGLVPATSLIPHFALAVIFFNGSWIAFALFSLVIARDQQNKLPRWLLFPSIATVTCFATGFAIVSAAFLFDGHISLKAISSPHFSRPTIWPAALLEWLIVATTILWVVLVASCLHRRQFQSNSPKS